MTSQHGGGHSFYGSNRKKRCSKWRTFNFENDHRFWTLFVTFESQNSLFLAFYLKPSYFNSFKLRYKTRFLALRSPLITSEYTLLTVRIFLYRSIFSPFFFPDHSLHKHYKSLKYFIAVNRLTKISTCVKSTKRSWGNFDRKQLTFDWQTQVWKPARKSPQVNVTWHQATWRRARRKTEITPWLEDRKDIKLTIYKAR